jgi:hypothetical protein
MGEVREMLTQTRNAIEALKKSGFKRSEFSAQVERDVFIANGRRCTEYGKVNIVIWASKERQFELIDAMLANGLNVTLFEKADGSYGWPHVSVAGGELGEKEIIRVG